MKYRIYLIEGGYVDCDTYTASEQGITFLVNKLQGYAYKEKVMFVAPLFAADDKTKWAVETLTQALLHDKDYFQGWQSNLAMVFMDNFSRYTKENPQYDLREAMNVCATNFLQYFIAEGRKKEEQ